MNSRNRIPSQNSNKGEVYHNRLFKSRSQWEDRELPGFDTKLIVTQQGKEFKCSNFELNKPLSTMN